MLTLIVPEQPVQSAIIHDVIDADLPTALAGQCDYCTGAVTFGGVVYSYPSGRRPAWLMHGVCFAALQHHFADLPARIAELLAVGSSAFSARSVS